MNNEWGDGQEGKSASKKVGSRWKDILVVDDLDARVLQFDHGGGWEGTVVSNSSSLIITKASRPSVEQSLSGAWGPELGRQLS